MKTKNTAGPRKVFTRVTMLHINGQTSEICMQIPEYSKWRECYELSAVYAEQYALNISRHYVKIAGYQISIVISDGTGTEQAVATYKPVLVPENKVFVPANKLTGEWMDFETAKFEQLRRDGVFIDN